MVPMDRSTSGSFSTQQAIILDMDRSGSSWLVHLLLEHEGPTVARACYARHHPKLFPPSLDRFVWAEAEFSPSRRTGKGTLARLYPVKTWPSLRTDIDSIAAASLMSEVMIRSRVTQQEAPSLFSTAVFLLDQFAHTRCSAPQAALFGLHRLLLELSLLSHEASCPGCGGPPLSSPARFHLTSGELTCLHHSTSAEGPIEWGPEKLGLHMALLSFPELNAFLETTRHLWERFGLGLAWSFLGDVAGFAEHTAGNLKSWSFLRQLRPLPRGPLP